SPFRRPVEPKTPLPAVPLTALHPAERRRRCEIHDLELGHALTEPHFEPHALPEGLVALGSGASREPFRHATRVGEQGEHPLNRYGDGLDDGSTDSAHEWARRWLLGSHSNAAVSTGYRVSTARSSFHGPTAAVYCFA